MLQEIFYSPKSLENQITVSTKILSSTTDFNIDNMFLKQQISISSISKELCDIF